MTTINKIDELKKIVTQYDTESFAGFFAYFIKMRPDDSDEIELNKFDSKLKDFFYLIALNAFAETKGTEEFSFKPKLIGELADKLNDVKNGYRVEKFSDYTIESVIHEMAFRNHFDNGVLSFVEQDLEKIRTVFSPFEGRITESFGLDIDFLIKVYKATELVSKIRFDQVMKFTHTKEFNEFHQKLHVKQIPFSEALKSLPEDVKDAMLTFSLKTHACLLFSKEDLYLTLAKEKVDRFLELFSCKPKPLTEFNYYTDFNPLELAPILEISENKYLHIYQKQIPIAVYKFLYDFLLKDKQYNEKVRRHREKSLEKKVSELFRSFFSSSKTFLYENYFVEKGHEQDLLILSKGTALIVETKASKLREPFRDIKKAVVRLKDDFKDSIQYGYNQCNRVEMLFLSGKIFDISDEKGNVLFTANPKRFHTVLSIVVTLERFGSLQTDLSLMLQKEHSNDYPWSVYIDDLEIFLLTLKHHIQNPQGKLVDFLRRRKLLHGHMYAIDELDVCGTYFKSSDNFGEFAKRNDTLISFSPKEQGIFDNIYQSWGLRFKEEPMPDFYRYLDKQNRSIK